MYIKTEEEILNDIFKYILDNLNTGDDLEDREYKKIFICHLINDYVCEFFFDRGRIQRKTVSVFKEILKQRLNGFSNYHSTLIDLGVVEYNCKDEEIQKYRRQLVLKIAEDMGVNLNSYKGK